MRTPDDQRRWRGPGSLVVGALVMLVAVGCGDGDDEPERLNGGPGTVTMIVDRTPDADRAAVPAAVSSAR